MENFTPANQIIESLIRFRKWWLVPTAICTLLAVFFALFSSKSYTTRQTLVVRDDLVGTFFKPGRFDSLDSMKSAQETILEISRRPHVVRSSLKRIGPTGFRSEASWLSDENIQAIQGTIKIAAPNGAEFGRTEAIVLSVQASSRERSRQFIAYLLDEIETSIQDLRVRQSESMQRELQQAASVAEATYRNVAAQLKAFESRIGADLGTLISLNDSQAGTNHLQSELAELNIEHRKAWANLEDVKKQIQILGDVSNSPEDLLAVPQELLQLQPTLASLARGLNDAVLRYSQTKGRYKQHPRIGEDRRAVEDIKERINEKLADTISSLNFQLELREDKYVQITKLIDEKKIRLGELSSMRVDYATLREEVSKKREINGKAQASLAEIQSLAGSAQSINLISRVDEPQTGIYPDGPSNKIIVFGGMFAGMFIGFGLVMFVAPLDDPDSATGVVPPEEFTGGNSSKRPQTSLADSQQEPSVSSNSNSISAQMANSRQQDLSKPAAALAELAELKSGPVESELSATDHYKPVTANELSSQQQFQSTSITSQSLPESAMGDDLAKNSESPANAAFVSEPPQPIQVPTIDNVTNSTSSPIASADEETPDEETPEIKASEIDPSEFKSSSLRPGGDDHHSIAEKINQLEQGELTSHNTAVSPVESITNSAAVPAADQVNEPPFAKETSTGLPLSTSIENSSDAQATGHESDPQIGIEPDHRPTATTVDLRMLKDQLSGKTKRDTTNPAPHQKKLSEVLANCEDSITDEEEKNSVVDRSISDLASSIRDMCKRDEKTD